MKSTEIIFPGTGDAFNTDGLANQSIIIRKENFSFLVDAGPSCLCRLNALEIKPETLKYIFITHFHGDHTAGLPFLLNYLKKAAHCIKLPIIIGPQGIRECVHALCEAAYRGLELHTGLVFQEFPHEFSGNISFGTEERNRFSFDVYPIHHKPESIGFKFRLGENTIGVSGDTPLDDALLLLADNCDVLITECSTEKAEMPAHISVEELEKNIGRINARMVIPVHSSKKIRKKLGRIKSRKIRIVTDGSRIMM